MFLMTINQSVKQISTTIICFNWFPDLLKRSQHIHGLKTIISIVLAYFGRCTKIRYDLTSSKNGVTCKQTRT